MTTPGLIRDEASHTYFFNGVRVPSVTQILKPLQDFSGIPPDVLARKAAIGTAVHAACEFDDLGELDNDSVHELVAPYLEGYRKWRLESGVEILECEAFVYHPTLRYAGQLDRIVRIQGRKWLVDLKTAFSFSPTWSLQTRGYGACRPDARELKYAALRLKKDGTYKWHPFDGPEYAADALTWTSLVQVHHWKAKHLQ